MAVNRLLGWPVIVICEPAGKKQIMDRKRCYKNKAPNSSPLSEAITIQCSGTFSYLINKSFLYGVGGESDLLHVLIGGAKKAKCNTTVILLSPVM